MPLSKKDTPGRVASDAETEDAKDELIESGAGAPDSMRDAAEDLPENDEVQTNIKEAMLADDTQDEAQHKAAVVENSSTGAQDTPSGHALLETADIADPIERGEEYARIKAAMRHGSVPAKAEDLKSEK